MNQLARSSWRSKTLRIGGRLIEYDEARVGPDFAARIERLDYAVRRFTGAISDEVSRDNVIGAARAVMVEFDLTTDFVKESTRYSAPAKAAPLRVTMEIARALMDCFAGTLEPKDGNRLGDELNQKTFHFYDAVADHRRTDSALWDLRFYDWARLRDLTWVDPHAYRGDERESIFSASELADFFSEYEARFLRRMLESERRPRYDGQMLMSLSDPLANAELYDLIQAWRLRPSEIRSIDENGAGGAPS
ncbi:MULTISPECIES: hypothetical protein [Burkholderia]|uniref:hypothetical protein n=1 Tax=Burkholderia TaxID=32008 RepID=UPI0005B6DC02|nr:MULTISPECIES: hypothetical protein [Burkholderia]KIP17295.1 hypothetical protein KY49_6846 [Burkholderia sp. MSHR3999]